MVRMLVATKVESPKSEPMPISRLLLLKIEEKKGGAFFTFLVFNQVTSRHSGSYTCVASNSAASVNYTAQLLVKG